MKIKFLVFLLIILLVVSLLTLKHNNNQITSNVIREDKITEFGPEPAIYFCPRQNCSSALFGFINSAHQSVHCAFFDLDLKNIIGLLKEKSKTIDIKVVVDNDNYKNNEIVSLPFVKPDTSSQFSHNKFCVVDDEKISTGSFNPTVNDAFFNNNNLIIIESRHLAENYEDEFKELWNRTFGRGTKVRDPRIEYNGYRIENYFCPEDRCSEHIIKEIRKANKSIYFMMFSFTHPAIATDLVLSLQAGVDVKGIFEKSQRSEYSRFSLLDNQGAHVKWDKNPHNMHHKVFVIDNRTVITGSFNPSKNADSRNDENILIIEDEEIANKYLDEFSIVYN